MLWRAQYRALVAQELIDAGTLAQNRVFQSRALPTGLDMLPAILLQTPKDRKVSTGRGAPKFNVTFDLYIVARLDALTYQAAEDSIEVLVEQIELAILANPATVNPLEQFEAVETQIMIDGTGKTFVGEASMLFKCEFYQAYDPPLLTRLSEIDVDVHSAPGGPTTASVQILLPA